MFAIENKNNKQKINEPKLKMKKTKLCQSALYSFFLCDIAFFFLGRLRNPKSAFFLGKKWRKDNKETKKKKKKEQIAKSAYETETKHEYAKHSVAIGFLFVCSWEECRFPISESPKEKKQKEYNAKHSGAISFLFVFSISYVFVVCFFGMFPCCVIFALFMYFLFPLKCSILRHNNRPSMELGRRWGQ